MKLLKALCISLLVLTLASSVAMAGDFDWLRDLNVQAQADPSGFKVRLGARFKIGNVEIDAVLSNVEKPADAYMILRMAEMSRRPPDYVVTRYRSAGGKGWGTLAKSLGIQPGSSEFHALKNGHDLDHYANRAEGKGTEKNKGKERNRM
jgi:hypothetical protein